MLLNIHRVIYVQQILNQFEDIFHPIIVLCHNRVDAVHYYENLLNFMVGICMIINHKGS